MKLLKLLSLIVVALFLSACANTLSGDVYSREQARRQMTVRPGVVESVREVRMEGTHSGVGTMAGAGIGGIAGSNIGGGKGQIIGAIIGAVAGGLIGSSAEEKLTEKNALEITVKLDSGELIAIVQEMGENFRSGDRVRVIGDYRSSRVTR